MFSLLKKTRFSTKELSKAGEAGHSALKGFRIKMREVNSWFFRAFGANNQKETHFCLKRHQPAILRRIQDSGFEQIELRSAIHLAFE